MSAPAIIFDQVWKRFHRGEVHDSLRDLIPAAIRSLTGRGPKSTELEEGDFWAVKNLSFEVHPGQTLGIIGPNGSGKSTTLKLLTRIYQPTAGYAELRGRVGTLIELSAGFHGDLTGRENVYLQGAIMGMRTNEIKRKFDDIVDFAGIADFIETPVKRYSSGMNARLGFSIAVHLEPEILIIDEVLAVGDLSFQARAFGRIRDLSRSGIPVVIVSHQLDRIAELCTEVICLNKGEERARGSAKDVIAAYISQNQTPRNLPIEGPVDFTSVELLSDGKINPGDHVSIRVRGRINEDIPEHVDPIIVRVRALQTGNIIYFTGARPHGVHLPERGEFEVEVGLQMNVCFGNYTIEVVAHNSHSRADVAEAPTVLVAVAESSMFGGFVQLNVSMKETTHENFSVPELRTQPAVPKYAAEIHMDESGWVDTAAPASFPGGET